MAAVKHDDNLETSVQHDTEKKKKCFKHKCIMGLRKYMLVDSNNTAEIGEYAAQPDNSPIGNKTGENIVTMNTQKRKLI